jgi:hypothetical protein
VLAGRRIGVVEQVNHVARRVGALLDQRRAPLQQPHNAAPGRRRNRVKHEAHERLAQAVDGRGRFALGHSLVMRALTFLADQLALGPRQPLRVQRLVNRLGLGLGIGLRAHPPQAMEHKLAVGALGRERKLGKLRNKHHERTIRQLGRQGINQK